MNRGRDGSARDGRRRPRQVRCAAMMRRHLAVGHRLCCASFVIAGAEAGQMHTSCVPAVSRRGCAPVLLLPDRRSKGHRPAGITPAGGAGRVGVSLTPSPASIAQGTHTPEVSQSIRQGGSGGRRRSSRSSAQANSPAGTAGSDSERFIDGSLSAATSSGRCDQLTAPPDPGRGRVRTPPTRRRHSRAFCSWRWPACSPRGARYGSGSRRNVRRRRCRMSSWQWRCPDPGGRTSPRSSH